MQVTYIERKKKKQENKSWEICAVLNDPTLDGTYVEMVCKAYLHINASHKDKLYDFAIQLPNSSFFTS